jgi:hypothetical protein
MALLVIVAGVTVSFSRATAAGRELQALADAGALAGLHALGQRSATEASVRQAVQALSAVTKMGTRQGPATLSVVIESRAPFRLTVTARDEVPVLFGGLVGLDSMQVTRFATAVGDPPRTLCLLLLDAAAAGALSIGGSSAVRARECVAQINSAASGAISAAGGGSATMDVTQVTGPASALRNVSPTPLWEQPAMEDPFEALITWPSADAACTRQSVSISASDASLPPGVYCGGLTIGSNAGVTLEPGVHVIKTGNLNIGSKAVLEAPGGVTIVLIDPQGLVEMRGKARIEAPREGAWRGMAIAVKPQGVERVFTMTAEGEMQIAGAVYIPTQRLEITGNSATVGGGTSSLIVAKRLTLLGTGRLALEGDAQIFSMLATPLRLTH